MNTENRDREIVFTRWISAPAREIWNAWTNPDSLAQWFGPNGFTVTTHEAVMKQGGNWTYTMHGPDKIDYPNHMAYSTFVPPSRLEYDHAEIPGDEPICHTTVTMEDHGSRTRFTMQMLFPSMQARDEIISQCNAIEGGNQTLDRLEAFLSNA